MSITAEYHPGVLLNNSRSGNIQKDVEPFQELQQLQQVFPEPLEGINGLQTITPGFLAENGIQFIGVRGGDGSVSAMIDAAVKAEAIDGMPRLIVLTGGGTVNTFKSEIRRQGKKVTLPPEYSRYFPEDRYEVVDYRPPQLSFANGSTQSVAYLSGACHLTVDGTRQVDRLTEIQGVTNPNRTYRQAGIKSLLRLGQPILQPQLVSYDGQTITSGGLSVPVCLTIGVPHLGTFQFTELIDEDKIRLLYMQGDPVTVRLKYLAMAMIGVYFPHGPDDVIKWNLLTQRDVTKATIVPDENPHQPVNFNVDGQLYRYPGPVDIERGPHLTFIVPKEVKNRD